MILSGAAGCAATPPVANRVVVPPPVVVATAQPAPTSPPPASAPAPVPRYSGDWRDWPVTPGTWVYRQDARGSIALFGVLGADAEVTLRCDRAARVLYLSRKGAAPDNAPMVLRTSSVTRSLASQPTGATPAYMATALNPADPLLDAIAFSRGRFIIEQAILPTLVIPAWAEPARVIEDCRQP
jgi:hypothetical protein